MKLLLLVFLASASGAGAQFFADKTGVLVLTPRIKIALFSQRTLDASNINVDTNDLTRTVTLSGAVTSPEQKSLAKGIAQKSATGYEVRDHLVVRIQAIKFQTGVPLKYRRVAAFFELLGRSQGKARNFGEPLIAFPHSDARRIAGFVSRRGVTLRSADPGENGGRPRTLSRALLERDLKRTGGSAFESFARAGYILSQPSVRTSDLEFRETPQGVIIDVQTGPRLTWVREGGRLFLRKLEYTQKTTR